MRSVHAHAAEKAGRNASRWRVVESVRYVSEQTPDDEERAVIGDRGGVRGAWGRGAVEGRSGELPRIEKKTCSAGCWEGCDLSIHSRITRTRPTLP